MEDVEPFDDDEAPLDDGAGSAVPVGLTEPQKAAIQEAYRAWLEGRGFKARRGQREMIALVARVMTNPGERIGIVEAGTGTGKTVAYCLAAIPVAQSLGKRVVISTATVALQEQVLLQDLPDLQQHTALEFTFALAKGRGRYLCPKRLDDALRGEKQTTLELFGPPDGDETALYEAMRVEYTKGTWDGEIDSWEGDIARASWSRVTTDHRGCSGKRCNFFHQCPFFKARAGLQGADVVVANHDLVLSDLALGGGVVLPPPEETLFVLDEAHHLPEKTQQRLMRTLRIEGAKQWLDQVTKSIGTMVSRFNSPPDGVDGAAKLTKEAETAAVLLDELRLLVDQLEYPASGRDDERAVFRFSLGRIPEEICDLAQPLAECFGRVTATLGEFNDKLSDAIDGNSNWKNPEQAEDYLPVVGQLTTRGVDSQLLFEDYANWKDASRSARWVARLVEGSSMDFELNSAPLEPGDILREVLWEPGFGVLATSATLCAPGGFERFRVHAGIERVTEEAQIASPFDFPNVATLSVPRMSSDPRNAAEHTAEVATMLPKLLELERSALVLFTSWRQFREVSELLPSKVLDRAHRQGDTSKRRLLREHREAIDQGEASYIFGLASFAEGIDLPGDYCRHVIIAKLPFAAPDNPIDEASAEWLQQDGRNPFYELTVPDTALRLAQACGRLIRSDADEGRITLLDRRIVEKSYGRDLMRALPAFRREVG